ncbi:Probable DNA helicase MCM9 [Linum grandiflorum]
MQEKSITSNHQEDSAASIWTVAMLRRYIQFVKGYFRPVLTKEAEKVISNYFQLQRRSAKDNAARTTIRMLESLIRLAQDTKQEKLIMEKLRMMDDPFAIKH